MHTKDGKPTATGHARFALVWALMTAMTLAGCVDRVDRVDRSQAGTGTERQLTPPIDGQPDAPPSARQPSAPETPAAVAELEQRIDDVLGEHEAYREAFDQLQGRMAAGDKAGVAELVDYPVGVSVNGTSTKVRTADEFIANYDAIVTPEIRQVVAAQRFSELLVNATNGVMFGDGQVWINGVCRDVACAVSDVRVTAIQSGSDSRVASASGACAEVDTRITGARAREYAQLVVDALGLSVDPGSVQIVGFMETGSWSAVQTTTPVTDPGVLFFHDVDGSKRFQDVWGGVAVEAERTEAVKWAEALGAPLALATCFADAVVVTAD